MAVHPWFPERAGGINLFEDPSSIPDHQLVACSNYYPHGKRWRLIQGNRLFSSSANMATLFNQYMVEYQSDNGSGGTNKLLIRFVTNSSSIGRLEEISSGSPITLTGGPAFVINDTIPWDSTVFQGRLLLTNGGNNLLETSNGTTFAETAGSPPSAPRYIENYKNRVFLAGRTAAPLDVNYCADGDRTTWTGNDASTETIPSSVGDFATGIRAVENYLAMFTRRTVTCLIGDHPDDWTKRTIFEDHGCISHRTIQKANGGLIYANDFGVWLLNSDLRRLELSRDIRPYWQNAEGSATRRNRARGRFMHAVYDPTPDRNRYCIWLSEGSNNTEEVCWIYHFNQNAWSRMDNFMAPGDLCSASCLREDANGVIEVYFSTGSIDTSTLNHDVYVIDNSTTFDAVTRSSTGGDITSTMTTKIFGTEPGNAPQPGTLGFAKTKNWKNFFVKLTDPSTSGPLTFVIYSYQDTSRVLQRSFNVQLTGTGNIVRARVPLSVTGWGTQFDILRTGSLDHDIIGGIFVFEDVGDK